MALMRGSDIFNLALCDIAVLDLNAGQSGLPTGQQGKIVVRINDFFQDEQGREGRSLGQCHRGDHMSDNDKQRAHSYSHSHVQKNR